jgi:glutamate-1-semialdehyde 2,1-aminomutase
MTEGSVWNFTSAQGANTSRYGELFSHLLERGVYVAPSQFEAMFVSTAHGPAEVERTVEAARELLGG